MSALRAALTRTAWPGVLWMAACGAIALWPSSCTAASLTALLLVALGVGHAWPARDR